MPYNFRSSPQKRTFNCTRKLTCAKPSPTNALNAPSPSPTPRICPSTRESISASNLIAARSASGSLRSFLTSSSTFALTLATSPTNVDTLAARKRSLSSVTCRATQDVTKLTNPTSATRATNASQMSPLCSSTSLSTRRANTWRRTFASIAGNLTRRRLTCKNTCRNTPSGQTKDLRSGWMEVLAQPTEMCPSTRQFPRWLAIIPTGPKSARTLPPTSPRWFSIKVTSNITTNSSSKMGMSCSIIARMSRIWGRTATWTGNCLYHLPARRTATSRARAAQTRHSLRSTRCRRIWTACSTISWVSVPTFTMPSASRTKMSCKTHRTRSRISWFHCTRSGIMRINQAAWWLASICSASALGQGRIKVKFFSTFKLQIKKIWRKCRNEGILEDKEGWGLLLSF